MFSVRKKASTGILAAAGILPGILLGLAGCGGSSDIALPSPDPLTPYRLATYRASDAGDGAPRAAIVIGDTMLDLAAADALFATETGASPFGFAEDLIAVIAAGDAATARLNQLANHFAGREDGFRFRVEPHRLTAPLLYPANLLAAAANYRSHAAEMDVEQEVDPEPGRALPLRQVRPLGDHRHGRGLPDPARPRPDRLGRRTGGGHRQDRPPGPAGLRPSTTCSATRSSST